MTSHRAISIIAPILVLLIFFALLTALTGEAEGHSEPVPPPQRENGVGPDGRTYDVNQANCARYAAQTVDTTDILVNWLHYDADTGHEIYHLYVCEENARTSGRTTKDRFLDQAYNHVADERDTDRIVHQPSSMVSWNGVTMTLEQFRCFQDKTTNPFTDTLASTGCD